MLNEQFTASFTFRAPPNAETNLIPWSVWLRAKSPKAVRVVRLNVTHADSLWSQVTLA